ESLPAADSVGLSGLALTYPLDENPAAGLAQDTAPAIAILREQGTTGHTELAAAFHAAGFAPHDVHMSDLEAGRVSLNSFRGLALPGGSTFSDALGAGFAWAQKILNDSELRSAFEEFFQREDTFTLGVGNGAQVLSHLQALIPGAEHWPAFKRNRSDQFEARVALVEVVASPSIFLQGIEGSRLPVTVGHAEGRGVAEEASQVALRFVDERGAVASTYPANPNGSEEGATGFTSTDGRVTALMPHPERVFRVVQNSWYPAEWQQQEAGPWLRMFRNARRWVADN